MNLSKNIKLLVGCGILISSVTVGIETAQAANLKAQSSRSFIEGQNTSYIAYGRRQAWYGDRMGRSGGKTPHSITPEANYPRRSRKTI